MLRGTLRQPVMIPISRKTQILGLGLAAVAGAAVAFGAVVFGGAVTVAATDPHYAPVEWMLETTMESSVRTHAADIEVPAGLDLRDPALAEHAFGHYSVACTPCHGAPGVDAAPWLVLNPPAEPLVDTADRWSDAELYWIVKHGIKMTGMPALGPTHGDDDLWAIAAFVRQLPEMTADRYAVMAERHEAKMQAAMSGAAMAPADHEVASASDAPQTVEPSVPPPPAARAEPKSKMRPRKPRPEPAQAPRTDATPAPTPPSHGGHAHHH